MQMLASGWAELLSYLSAHVLTCLVPAFFIAGGIAAFVSGGAILRYLGPKANPWVAYGVAAVSGSILAVCSCTVLPLFAGIYKKGAGLGPAVTFLYSAPAINILAIVLTARKLGWELGLGRAVGAVLFAALVGLLMAVIFRQTAGNTSGQPAGMFAAGGSGAGDAADSPIRTATFFGLLVAILLAGTLPVGPSLRWGGLTLFTLALILFVRRAYSPDERHEWLFETWKTVRLIFPILLVGVFVAGMLKVVLPTEWVSAWVGGNSISANGVASGVGALMYFSTLTEVPILRMLLDLGMGMGPALALLLAGPAVSLPNLLVVRNIMGTARTVTYAALVIVLATASGLLFGSLFAA